MPAQWSSSTSSTSSAREASNPRSASARSAASAAPAGGAGSGQRRPAAARDRGSLSTGRARRRGRQALAASGASSPDGAARGCRAARRSRWPRDRAAGDTPRQRYWRSRRAGRPARGSAATPRRAPGSRGRRPPRRRRLWIPRPSPYIVLARELLCTRTNSKGNPLDTAYRPTSRTTPTRYRERAQYDRATVHAILDEALICHLGYLGTGGPVVLPTTHARLGDTLYLHGSTGAGPMLAGRAAEASGSGLPVCVTVTLLDGLVLARTAMHHSVNFRSVVVIGAAR